MASSEEWTWSDGITSRKLVVSPCVKGVIKLTKAPGSVLVDLTEWDVKKAIQSVIQETPLYTNIKIGREISTCELAFHKVESMNRLRGILHGRTVPIGPSKLKVDVQQGGVTLSSICQAWKEHFFHEEANASLTVFEELFKRAKPGRRPDTILIRDVPRKFFGISSMLDEGEEHEEGEEGEVSELEQAREALTGRMQQLGGWVVQSDVDIKDLRCDIYVQFRKLSEVLNALERLHGKVLKYGQQLIVPLEVDVDMTGFFSSEGIVARKEKAKIELERKKSHRGRYLMLQKERTEMSSALDDFKREASEGGVADVMRKTFDEVYALLKKCDSWDAPASILDPEGEEALGQLNQLQEVLRKRLARVKDDVSARVTAEREKRRLEEVKDVRVEAATKLKHLDGQWRGVLGGTVYSDAAEGSFCKPYVEAVNQSLAEARDLVLKAAAEIHDIPAYSSQVKRALEIADEKAARAVTMLKTETRTKPLLEKMKELEQSVGQEGGGGGEEEEGQRTTKPPKASWGSLSESSGSDEENDDDAAGKDGWHWPFPKTFLGLPEMVQLMDIAKAAAIQLEELREKNDPSSINDLGKVLEVLEHELERLVLQFRNHKAVIPWAEKYDELWNDEKKEELKENSILKQVSSAAETAINRCRKCVIADDDEFGMLLETMQKAVERAEKALANEVRQKREREEERQRRKADKERRRKEKEEETKKRKAARREEKEKRLQQEQYEQGIKRLEGLERRKAFLQESFRIEKAREQLTEARKAGLVFDTNPKPVSRLLQAAGVGLSSSNVGGSGNLGEGEEEEGYEYQQQPLANAIETAVSREGSYAVVPMDLIEEKERWQIASTSLGVPLNLVSRCLPNQVSDIFWEDKQKEEEGEGQQQQQRVFTGPSLKSEVAIAPLGANRKQVQVEGGDAAAAPAWKKIRRSSFPPSFREDRMMHNVLPAVRRGLVLRPAYMDLQQEEAVVEEEEEEEDVPRRKIASTVEIVAYADRL